MYKVPDPWEALVVEQSIPWTKSACYGKYLVVPLLVTKTKKGTANIEFSRSSSEVNVDATSSLFRDILDLGIILVFIGIFSKKKCRFQPFLLICEIYSA